MHSDHGSGDAQSSAGKQETVEREERYRSLLERAVVGRPAALGAIEFRGALHTKSSPSIVLCDDGQEYVVKGRNAGRSTFNDQVVGRLGMAMRAPVAQVTLVDVPLDLILENIEMKDLVDGVAHGSRLILKTSNAERLLYFDEPENRSRFAALALLYGWPLVEEDHQFIYGIETPHLVYSVDHGDSFPRGPGWSRASLLRVDPPQPDPVIRYGCNLTDEELSRAAVGLAGVDDGPLVEAIAAPPDDWGVTMDERLNVALYLAERREQLLSTLTRQSQGE